MMHFSWELVVSGTCFQKDLEKRQMNRAPNNEFYQHSGLGVLSTALSVCLGTRLWFRLDWRQGLEILSLGRTWLFRFEEVLVSEELCWVSGGQKGLTRGQGDAPCVPSGLPRGQQTDGNGNEQSVSSFLTSSPADPGIIHNNLDAHTAHTGPLFKCLR